MRAASIYFACLFTSLAGCARSQNSANQLATRHWEALCHCMPQHRSPSDTREIHLASLTTGQQAGLQQVALQASDFVVHVKTDTPRTVHRHSQSSEVSATASSSGGTGIIISEDGLILTNEHVVRHAQTVTIVTNEGIEYTVESIVVHEHFDLALLKIDGVNLRAAETSPEPLIPGMHVVAVTCPFSAGHSCFRTGVVTNERISLQRELDPAKIKDYGALVETTVRLEPGFSGGPLLNNKGNLVGLNVAVMGSIDSGQARSYAMPLSPQMHGAIKQLVKLSKRH